MSRSYQRRARQARRRLDRERQWSQGKAGASEIDAVLRKVLGDEHPAIRRR
jgi:hypothetical protein